MNNQLFGVEHASLGFAGQVFLLGPALFTSSRGPSNPYDRKSAAALKTLRHFLSGASSRT